jgi:hypothetical protein
MRKVYKSIEEVRAAISRQPRSTNTRSFFHDRETGRQLAYYLRHLARRQYIPKCFPTASLKSI